MNDTLLLDPDLLEPVLDDDDNDVLAAPAAAIERVPIRSIDVGEALLEESVVGYIKKKYDEHKHPRWPKDTPRAGQFMRVGQSFTTGDGKRWQITSTAGGKVEAAEASGKATNVEHRIFKPTKDAVDGPGVGVAGVKIAEPTRLKGGAYHSDGSGPESTTVVMPYVDPSSHKVALAKPAESKLTAEEWQRFGEVDQDYYSELMDRFGKWSPSSAQSMMDAIYAQYDSEVRNTLTTAFGLQYGPGFWGQEGGGRALNLAFMFQQAKNPAALAQAWASYEKVKTAMHEINEVVHWDLYNRTRSPDIVLFHGGGSGVATYKSEYISGKTPIYAGFSQSYSLSGAESWGSTIMMTPVAIRHVAMSHYTRLPTKKGTMSHELEIAVGVRMKLDDRSVTYNSSDYGMGGTAAKAAISKWLHGDTSQQPAGGKMVQELKDVWAGKGHIPIPAEPLGLTPIHVSGTAAQVKKLPDDAAATAGAMAWKLNYKSEDGSKEGAIGKIDGMGLKPGDFIEGKQGTRYIILSHPGDTNQGLAYAKVEQSGTINYQKAYPFSSSAGNDFYRLDGHFDVPKDKAEVGFKPFTPEQYAALAQGAKKKLVDFKPGEMFKADGDGYKVTGPAPGGSKMAVESLDTGKQFTASALHETPQWVPKEGVVIPEPMSEEPTFKPKEGELVHVALTDATFIGVVKAPSTAVGDPTVWDVQMPDGKTVLVNVSKMSEPKLPVPEDGPQPGDIFASGGVKFTVTSVLKDGTIRARPQGGKVQKFAKDHPDASQTFRPGDYKVASNAKVKAGNLMVGELVSGSDAKVRPYMVASNDGKNVWLTNLETGAQSKVTAKKSMSPLVKHADAPAEEPKPSVPPKPDTTIEYEAGPTVKHGSLDIGDKFTMANIKDAAALHYEVTGDGVITPIKDGQPTAPFDVAKINADWKDADVIKLVPKGTAPGTPPQVTANVEPSSFDMSLYQEGPKLKMSDIPEGTVILTGTGLPALVKSKKPAGGATVLALHNGKLIKKLPYEKEFTTLVAKADSPDHDHGAATKGDTLMAKHLEVGDQFHIPGYPDEIFQMTKALEGDQAGVAKFVDASGALSPKDTVISKPEMTYVLHAKAGEAQPPSAPPDPIDIEELPPSDMAWLGSEPGTVPLDTLANGDHFTDANGKLWQKKGKSGSVTAISDGTGNFQTWTGNLVLPSSKSLTDTAPSVGASPTAALTTKIMKAQQHGSIMLGKLEPGDFFVLPIGVFEVKEHGSSGTTIAQNLHDGSTPIFGQGKDISTWAKAADVHGAGASGPDVFELAGGTKHTPASFVMAYKDTPSTSLLWLASLSDKDLKNVGEVAADTPGAHHLAILIAQEWEKRDGTGETPAPPKELKPLKASGIKVGEWYQSEPGGLPWKATDVKQYGGIDTGTTVVSQHFGDGIHDDQSVNFHSGFELTTFYDPDALPEMANNNALTVAGIGAGGWLYWNGHFGKVMADNGDGTFKIAYANGSHEDVQASLTPYQAEKAAVTKAKGAPADTFERGAWEDGEKIKWEDMPVGAVFKAGNGVIYKKTGADTLKNLETGTDGQTGFTEGPSFVQQKPKTKAASEPKTQAGIEPKYPVEPGQKLPAHMDVDEQFKLTPDAVHTYAVTGHYKGGKISYLNPDSGATGQMDNNVPVWPVGSMAGLDDSAKQSDFGEVPVGAHFDAHGAIWKKTGENSAEVVHSYDPNQFAEPGHKESHFTADSVAWLPPGESSTGPSTSSTSSTSSGPKFGELGEDDVFYVGGVAFVKDGEDKAINLDTGETEIFHDEYPTDSKLEVPPEDTPGPSPAAPPPAPATLATPPEASPLKPYLHHKSGTAKHTKLGKVPSGSTFTDKAGQKYTVIGHLGDETVFEKDDGTQFASGSNVWVKVLTLTESKVVALRWTTGGHLRLAA